MADLTQTSADWTKPEQWVWDRIAAGEPADLNARDREHNPSFRDLDPSKEEGWSENRRLRVKFLQSILTQEAFAHATPYGGVRVLGALVDDAPLNLEYARLQRLFWLERSRILTDVKCRNLRIDGGMSLERSFVDGGVDLYGADIRERLSFGWGEFHGEVGLGYTSIGGNLVMVGSTFEKKVILNSAKVKGTALLSGGAIFKGGVNLVSASIGSNLGFSAANIGHQVDLTGCQVLGELRLGSSRHLPARWEETAVLVLRNTHVGALQDWWRGSSDNSWPEVLELGGFTYERLGGVYGQAKEADMMARPSKCFIEWLGKDPSFSPQPYEQLASLFRRGGEPGKANDILYAGRERRRRLALSKVDDLGHSKDRECAAWVGLSLLRWTIGYGLGNRYFWALWWVGGFTLVGMVLLIIATGQHSPESWPPLFFASFDQLLPIIKLNKAHDALIFRDSAHPKAYWVVVYFYFHKIIGWALASFIVAGLAGLTQRN